MSTSDQATGVAAARQEQSLLRQVAVPTEHGGWSLTLEPAILGLIVAPSLAGFFIALAGLLAFVARTPTKLVLVDRFRNRWLPRTTAAAQVAAAETVVILALIAAATVLSGPHFWVPALVAAPLLAVEGYYEMRSRGRRLLPEITGSVAIAVLAAMASIAGGADDRLAYGLWLILAARAVTAMPHVKGQILRRKGHPFPSLWRNLADAIAVLITLGAVTLDRRLAAGPLAVLAAVVYQRITERLPVRTAIFIGVSQTVIGLGIIAATAVGVAVG